MWKLKLSKGEDDPQVRSVNHHIGRQFWEFDPSSGTQEERSEIENIREEFTKNKMNVKHSSDLLMRFQFANMNRSEIEKPEVVEKDDLKDEVLVKTLKKALKFYSTLQGEDGSWPSDYGGPLFLLPGLIIGLHVMEKMDAVLSAEHQKEIRRYIYNHQNVDGGWGLHIEGHSTMFCTALNYVSLRLLGETMDGGQGAMTRARTWILHHGSLTHVPSWGKLWLSVRLTTLSYFSLTIMFWILCCGIESDYFLKRTFHKIYTESKWSKVLGVYEWRGNNPLPPEIWLLPYCLPLHPGRMWCHTRMVYLPMSYLYGKRFVSPISSVVLSLRRELYKTVYLQEDLYYPHPRIQDFLWNGLNNFAEPLLMQWPFSKLRKKALNINGNGGFSSYELMRSYTWLEAINPAETFGDIIIDYPYVECTSAAVQGLRSFTKLYPNHRRAEIEACISKAISFIESLQLPDGMDHGEFAILMEHGKTYESSHSIRKACEFLLSKQLNCGGWGESYISCQQKVYTNITGNKAHITNTSWALLALIEAEQAKRDQMPLHLAAKVLVDHQMENGDFPQQEIIGVFNKNCMIKLHISINTITITTSKSLFYLFFSHLCMRFYNLPFLIRLPHLPPHKLSSIIDADKVSSLVHQPNGIHIFYLRIFIRV
ncbi:Prenyltransferase/squalene oxidase [Cynara cardunculus var. scolymus]|uniref:Prenyltransferase/squalene oxidase n=1 Tax=Cynara cardunculus var. scolymus TaxID=59895 RepID=A0A118JSN3_CYNCS|nr:Prenyltransferase/squalene oxidase [Cynara cardunculus var. scolymus]